MPANLTPANNPVQMATPQGVQTAVQSTQDPGQQTPPAQPQQQPANQAKITALPGWWRQGSGQVVGQIPASTPVKPSTQTPQPTSTGGQIGAFPNKLAELLLGGEADNVPDSKFPKKNLRSGVKHELEHTRNRQMAKEIAKDHLVEDVSYYSKAAAARWRKATMYDDEALDDLTRYMRSSVLAKKEFESRNSSGEYRVPDEKTAAYSGLEITPFAAAFFIGCRERGLSLSKVAEVTKQASAADDRVREELAGLNDAFFEHVVKMSGLGTLAAPFIPNAVSNAYNAVTDWGKQTVDSGKKWVADQIQQGAQVPVRQEIDKFKQNPGKMVQQLGDSMGLPVSQFMEHYGKGGLGHAISQTWGGMSPAQQASLIAMIGGPLIGLGTAFAGRPGLGAAIGLGGLGLGGLGMYMSKQTPSAVPSGMPAGSQPIPTAKPGEQPKYETLIGDPNEPPIDLRGNDPRLQNMSNPQFQAPPAAASGQLPAFMRPPKPVGPGGDYASQIGAQAGQRLHTLTHSPPSLPDFLQ